MKLAKFYQLLYKVKPLAYIQGTGGMLPGLERELEGKTSGNNLELTIQAKDAFGEYDENLVQVVDKKGFQNDDEGGGLEEGIQVQVDTQEGPKVATVSKIEGDDVTLDLKPSFLWSQS